LKQSARIPRTIAAAALVAAAFSIGVSAEVPEALAAAPAITVRCTKTRTECQSSLKQSFVAAGCGETKVTCSGRPPPPGGTTGDYTCTVESAKCSGVPAGGCGSGMDRKTIAGVQVCWLAPEVCCAKASGGCVCARDVLDSDCLAGKHVAVKDITQNTPVGGDMCVDANGANPTQPSCQPRPPGRNPVTMPHPGGAVVPGRAGTRDYCGREVASCSSTTPCPPEVLY
jgi:hypothetical protein